MARMNHTCEKSAYLNYELQYMKSAKLWGIYDRIGHSYLWLIEFCPFCGVKL